MEREHKREFNFGGVLEAAFPNSGWGNMDVGEFNQKKEEAPDPRVQKKCVQTGLGATMSPQSCWIHCLTLFAPIPHHLVHFQLTQNN